mmetsp:Transcript_21834/g.55013  ORF Transcript_21834/g.55013 Transcript_21834/m.55013 type:complete len:243 (-) Transcript_21834:779-1507(-)
MTPGRLGPTRCVGHFYAALIVPRARRTGQRHPLPRRTRETPQGMAMTMEVAAPVAVMTRPRRGWRAAWRRRSTLSASTTTCQRKQCASCWSRRGCCVRLLSMAGCYRLPSGRLQRKRKRRLLLWQERQTLARTRQRNARRRRRSGAGSAESAHWHCWGMRALPHCAHAHEPMASSSVAMSTTPLRWRLMRRSAPSCRRWAAQPRSTARHRWASRTVYIFRLSPPLQQSHQSGRPVDRTAGIA